MAGRRPVKTLLSRIARIAVAALVLGLTGCTLEQYPQSTLTPHSDYGWAIEKLLEQQVFWVVVIFVVVQGVMLYAMIRFRSRPGAPDPKPIHGNTVLEIAWTIAPAIILALVAVPTVLTIYKTQAPPPPGSLHVRVIGHQWWWEFQYPDLGVTTASELHVPVGRPIAFDIETADVMHSFWFPAMGGKRDALPNRINHMFFTADTTGTFPGQCAELCGVSHANMRMRLMVSTPDAFDTWVAGQKALPATPDSTSIAAKGKALFSQSACVACHTITGVSAGTIGPNLTHVASRGMIEGETVANDPAHLSRWISNAPAMKPGSLMPNLALTQDQVTVLVAYLTSLK